MEECGVHHILRFTTTTHRNITTTTFDILTAIQQILDDRVSEV